MKQEKNLTTENPQNVQGNCKFLLTSLPTNLLTRKSFAFTLAEVLITLGIIGVVAALTVPHFVQKYTERATVVKLKKVYSTLDNAYKMAQAEHGFEFRKDFDWNLSSSKRAFLDKLIPYLEVAVDCTHSAKSCYSYAGKEFGMYYPFLEPKKGSSYTYSQNKDSGVLLKDGTLIVVISPDNVETNDVNIMVDINGRAKPNQYGWDTFFFRVRNSSGEKIVTKSGWGLTDACSLGSAYQAQGCAWWVLKNENMDYLHCKLDWKTQTKCEK